MSVRRAIRPLVRQDRSVFGYPVRRTDLEPVDLYGISAWVEVLNTPTDHQRKTVVNICIMNAKHEAMKRADTQGQQ